ncbi:MAG: hypothetical protein K2V38_14105 [Gemmataceae bacterium]|nr:hypothetical protein [Gemmataceae bacterium]
MFPTRPKLRAFVVAVVVAVMVAGAAEAGWVTFKNDTKQALVVQEVTVVNGKQVRGKPTKLLAGESFREFQNMAGEKVYEVYDAANPNAPPVWTGKLNCKNDTQSFSVQTNPAGKVGVLPIPEPKKP